MNTIKIALTALTLASSAYVALPTSSAQAFEPEKCFDVVITCSRTTGECTATLQEVIC